MIRSKVDKLRIKSVPRELFDLLEILFVLRTGSKEHIVHTIIRECYMHIAYLHAEVRG